MYCVFGPLFYRNVLKVILFMFILNLIDESYCISTNSACKGAAFTSPQSMRAYSISAKPNSIQKLIKTECGVKNSSISSIFGVSKPSMDLATLGKIATNVVPAAILHNKIQLDHSIKTVILSGVYGIRVFKCMLYLRYIMEWLPQANPYLPPFCTVFTATNKFINFFHKICPSVMGFDFSGFLAWAFLENLERILLYILANH